MGASVLLANALVIRANELRGLGGLDEAAKAVNESKQLFASIGDKDGFARAQTMGAHLLNLQGDFVGASKSYEASLAMFRKIRDREGVVRGLNSIAVERVQLGDFHGAYATFKDALTAGYELLDQRSVALSQANLGEILLDLGDPRDAEQMYKQSLISCRATRNSDLAAHDLEGLGRVLQVQGRLIEARQDETEAIAMFDKGGQSQIIDAYMSLAGILLDSGLTHDAELAAQKALEQIKVFKLVNFNYRDADAVLARVLIAQGKVPDSRKIVDSATAAFGPETGKESEISFLIIAARVHSASSDRLERAEAAKSLQSIVDQTRRSGFVLEEFEARLALGEAETKFGDLSTVREKLITLKNAASAKGFLLIAQKVSVILQAQPGLSSVVMKASSTA